MFLATINKAKRLLLLSHVHQVTVQELRRGREDVEAMSVDLPPGMRVLADFSQLESMDSECAPELGKLMELAERSGVQTVVRVMPDPAKDIGLNILTRFRYRKLPHIHTCKTLEEAARLLSL